MHAIVSAAVGLERLPATARRVTAASASNRATCSNWSASGALCVTLEPSSDQPADLVDRAWRVLPLGRRHLRTFQHWRIDQRDREGEVVRAGCSCARNRLAASA